jgi:tRNA A-37 threonylcarbamoyl transferase component Bud32
MEPTTRADLGNRYFFAKKEAPEDYHQFWIRYKPERVLRARMKHWSVLMRILFCITVACALYSCFICGPYILIPFILLVLCFKRLLPLLFINYPTHLSLSDEGMRLHWLRSFCNISTHTIAWDQLTHVSISRRNFAGSEESILEFNLAAGSTVAQPLRSNMLMSLNSGWLTGGRTKVSIVLNGIASSDDRKRLQMALKKFLPTYRIDPAVSDELNLALRMETYTDLWLEAFNSDYRRVREERLLPGETISDGRYELVSELAVGGQSIVYEACELTQKYDSTKRGKSVVLKEFVLPAHAGMSIRKRVLEHIQKEANLLKKLSHPNIVKLHDFFVDDQRAYLVLEKITGDTLKSLVETKGVLTEEQVVLLGLQMCEILGYLHANKLVHRDISPDNLILGHGDILKLIDFNVAFQLEGEKTRSVVGKHAYIPPEQFRGKAGPQSDIYAAGGTLYFLLTGCDPEPITRSHPREWRPDLSPALDSIIARATETELSERFPSCIEFRNELQKLKPRYME